MASFEPYNLFAQRRKPSDLPDMNVNGVLDAPQDPVQQVASQMAQGNYPTLPIQKNKPVPQVTQNPPVMEKKDPEKDGMDYLASMWTSPEEEERMRKASVNRQRILAVGDALRHIGNIYNTVRYAPNQQFNNPVADEYNRYNREKSVRDAANQRYLSYQQAKAAQEQKARQWEQEFGYKRAKDKRDFDYRLQNDERNFGETKRKNDAYIASQDANRERTQALTKKTEEETKWIGPKAQASINNVQSQIRHRAHQDSIASRRLALSYANFARKGRGGGGGGGGRSGQPYRYATPNGYIEHSKNFTPQQIQQLLNMYGRKYGNISTTELINAGVNINSTSDINNYKVAKMLMENQEVADFARDRFGFDEYEGDILEIPGSDSIFSRASRRVNNFNNAVAKARSKPAAVPQGTPKPVAKPKAQGTGSKSGKSNNNRSGFFNS